MSRVGVDVVPRRHADGWPWQAKVTVYDHAGALVGVRFLRAQSETAAWDEARALLGDLADAERTKNARPGPGAQCSPRGGAT